MLVKADAGVVEKAVAAASGLSPLASCGDVEVLRAPVAPPADEAGRRAVSAAREQVAEAKALEDAARYPDGLGAARRAAEAAERTGYGPVRAEALLQLGSLLALNGELGASSDTVREALYQAIAARHREIHARAAILLMKVEAKQARLDEAAELARHARAAIAALGGSELLEASLEHGLGLVLYFKGEIPGAVEHFNHALAVREKLLGHDHFDVSSTLFMIGTALLAQQGQERQAVDYLERALAIDEKLLGPGHPGIAMDLNNIGEALTSLGDVNGALERQQRALGILVAALGEDHAEVATAASALGVTLLAAKRPAEALTVFERALKTCAAHECQADVAPEARFGAARALGALDQEPGRARALSEQARDDYRKLPGGAVELGEVEAWLKEHPSAGARHSGGAAAQR